MASGKSKLKGQGAGQPPRAVLPPGVALSDWALEKRTVQNPRIRALLGCVRVLDDVLESNFAILHCSPRRVKAIWKQVQKVAHTLREEVAPLLDIESRIPSIEDARNACAIFMTMLEDEVLQALEQFPAEVPDHRLDELRKLLCVATGQLQSFLQDTLGELMAADPRSQHDADYFLSRRFAHDVDESEWLLTSVIGLEQYLQSIAATPDRLKKAAAKLREQRHLLPVEEWQEIGLLLDELIDGLTPALKNTLGLRGIRLGEMELLEHHATEIPTVCRVLGEIDRVARRTIEAAVQVTGGYADPGTGDWVLVESNNAVLAAQVARLIRVLEAQLRDLLSFVPIWRQGIEHRRALSWTSSRPVAVGEGPPTDGIELEPP